MKIYSIEKYGITVKVLIGGGVITSKLKEHFCDSFKQDEEAYNINKAIVDTIEALILAHASAGINVSSKAYINGLDSCLEAIANNLD
jgi:hypothetical protein